MPTMSRRRLLRASLAAGTGLAGGLATSGCGHASISNDPDELVLWLWRRSTSPTLLAESARSIPGTTRHLRADYIGEDFDTKLRTSLAAGSYIPDLTFINVNNALYFPSEEHFLDLNQLGAAQYEDQFYPWKWKLGQTPKGRYCFFPHHTGPTGFFYRADLFRRAGLPSEPDEVSDASRSWDGWLELGQKLRRDGDAGLVNSAPTVFTQFVNASAQRYFDSDNRPLYEEADSSVRKAWDVAVQAVQLDVVTGATTTTDQNAALVSGRTAGNIEGNWWSEILADTAPKTAGHWRIARQPGPAGSSGGDFIAIPTTCKDPHAAFAWAVWLMTPHNQARAFNDIGLWPSSPEPFRTGAMRADDSFFGGQNTLEFFSAAAETIPTAFISTYESQVEPFTTELTNVSAMGKDPEQAWDDAVAQVNRSLRKRGVG